MTCIIATHEGVWGDRKISANTGEVCDPIRKVAAGDGYAIGFAGGFEGILRGIDMAEAGVSLGELAAKLTGAHALAVFKGRIYVIEASRLWRRRASCAFFAIGSGGTEAMAFLSGRGSITPDDIRAAQRHVARSRDDCGRGVNFEPAQ